MTIRKPPLEALDRSTMVLQIAGRPKANLLNTTRELHDTFAQEAQRFARTAERSSALVYCYNVGALLQYHYGEIGRASELSRHAVRLCLTEWRRTGLAAWVGDAVQPFINLGRLFSAQGRWRESLKLFDSVWHVVRGETVMEFEDIRVGTDVMGQISAEQRRELLLVTENVRVADSIRALLAAQEYEEVIDFVAKITEERRAVERPSLINAAIIEGTISGLIGARRYSDALEAIQIFIQNTPNVFGCHFVVHIHVAAACQGLGKLVEAQKALQIVARGLEALVNGPVQKFVFVLSQLWYLAGHRFYLVGDLDRAEVAARKSLELSRASGNEALALKATVLLSQVLDTSTEVDSIRSCRHDLAQLASSTHYRVEKAFATWELARTTDHATAMEYLRQSLTMFRHLDLPQSKDYEAELAAELRDAPDSGSRPNQPSYRNEQLDNLYAELIAYEPVLHGYP